MIGVPQDCKASIDFCIVLSNQNHSLWFTVSQSCLENVVVEVESQHGVVVWSSAQNCPSTILADFYSLQLIVVPEEEIQRHLSETRRQRNLEVGISCILSFGTFPSDLTRTVDLRTFAGSHGGKCWSSGHLWRHGDSTGLHWAGVRLHMNSWCSITLDWIASSIEMHSCLKSCRRFSFRVPQSVKLLLWKCLEPRTLHRPTADCPTCCEPTQ